MDIGFQGAVEILIEIIDNYALCRFIDIKVGTHLF